MRTQLDERTGEFKQIQKEVDDRRRALRYLRRDRDNVLEARAIIQHVAQETQKQLEYQISELASLALAGVFDDPYELVLEFVQKRGKTEAVIEFERDGVRVNPTHCTGGGAQDVAAFALQVALWGIKRNRPVMVLDEPLKWLKGNDYPERGADVIREISGKLGLQIIMVSHIPDQISHADKVVDLGGVHYDAQEEEGAGGRVPKRNRRKGVQRVEAKQKNQNG
jgi:DNA repair exonuclease SbcCD ATPase subunit